MKKFLLVLICLFSIVVNSQVISVIPNTDTSQLVNSILLNGACVGATNITSSTGTNFNSFNGIGSFTNTNPNFPMTKGVILSTGNVINAAGPNATALNEGIVDWLGDTDLKNALGNANALYLNASVLEFNFNPISPNFSFDFIFASEEYGGFQCAGFPDAFAFLLTNTSTNTTTNLAVLPNSNTPITVEKVRNKLYNSTCESANANFFSTFYGGSNSNISPTNFNGQTVLLTAAAVLTPGVTYKIKLVISDRNDVKYDSAVFISGTSFNIGQDVLGPDVTIAGGNAACFGSNYTIQSSLNPLLYDFEWSKVGAAGVLGTESTLTVASNGNYQLSYKEKTSTCLPEKNAIIVEFLPELQTIAPQDIIKCDIAGSTSYSFDIAQNTPFLLAGLPVLPIATTTIRYFSDALCTLPISSPYIVNSATPNQTVFVKITNTVTTCSTIKSFVLKTSPETAITPINGGIVTVCESAANSGSQSIVFDGYDSSFLGASQQLSQFSVTYYLTSTAANTGTSGQLVKNGYVVNNGTTIWVRVENKTDKNCFKTSSFIINVSAKPEITDVVRNVFVCTQYVLPPLVTPNAQYWSADNGAGINWSAGTVITKPASVNFVDVYIYLNSSCPDKTSFRIRFVDVTDIIPPTINNCDQFIIPTIEFGSFYTATHLNGGNGGTLLAQGAILTAPQSQDIFLYFKSIDEANCEIELPFTIKIDPSPVLPSFENIYKCINEFYTLLPLDRVKNPKVNYYSSQQFIPANIIPDGTRILATQTVYVHAESGLKPCTDDKNFTVFVTLPNTTSVSRCESYELPPLPVGKYYPNSGGPSASNLEIPIGTIILSSQKIYHYAKSDPNDLPVSQCVYDQPIDIKIVLPIVPTSINLNVTACGIYNLPTLPIIAVNTSVTPNQVYQQFSYNTKADGSGITINAGSLITFSQTVYVFIQDGTCSRGTSIILDIKPFPLIELSNVYPKCETFSLDKPANVEFYYGANRTGGIVPDGTVFTQDTRIYAYSETSAIPPCGLDYPIDIQIYFTKAIVYPNVTQCISYPLPSIEQPTPDDNNQYYSAPGRNAADLIPAGTIITTTQKIYVNNRKTARFLCEDESSFTVTISPNPDVIDPPDVIACDEYILPNISVGNYYEGSGKTGKTYLAGDKITSSQRVYIFAGNINEAGCNPVQEFFEITINKVDKLNNISRCYSYQLPVLTSGNYYSGQNGTLPITSTIITSTQKIYIWKRFPTVGGAFCESQTHFTVTIVPAPAVNAGNVTVASRTFCDTDGINDGKFLTDLNQYSATILGTAQTGSQFSVGYFATQFNAELNVNPITTPTLEQNIFVRVNNNTLNPSCYAIAQINVIINKLPEPENPEKLVICISNITGNILNPVKIDSGLNATNFSFIWKDKIGATISNASFIDNIVDVGTYTVTATNKLTNCVSLPRTTTTSLSQIAIASAVLSENFSDDQFVTVTATGVNGGSGNYEYQFDNNSYQNSNIFTNIPFDLHEITIRDKEGCGIVTIPVTIINYPKFFTPNDDGVNDKWNVIGLADQPNSNIFIFDRAGKLITQIKPFGAGWDGKYNGELLPSTDYWFQVSYLEKGLEKSFKAHFSMKR